MSRRVLFHVQHLLGIGHLKRAEILANALGAAGLDVTVALGGPPVPEIPFANTRIVQLPPATIADGNFSRLIDAAGQPVDAAWRDRRCDALLDAFRRLDPDVILLELFPFGRRQFRFELLPLLEAAHASPLPPRIACSVRDILVGSKGAERNAEIVSLLRSRFDAVLVHGDPAIVPFEATFPAAGEIADLLRYTGYVCEPAARSSDTGRDRLGEGEVIVSAGGGAVGAELLFTAAATRPKTALADAPWRFLAGPNLPGADYARLSALSDKRTLVERFRPDFGERLKTCALSISQAGYNTTMDLLRAGTRAVVVPFETPSETEQRRRADLLAQRGLLTVAPADGLSAETLATGIAAALASPKPNSASIDLDGAAKTATLVAELAERRMEPKVFALCCGSGPSGPDSVDLKRTAP
jgi:predicted glycosyltransferase